jgi:hypothetical protein
VLEGSHAALTAQDIQDAVDALPTDLALAALVEARSLLDKEHVCCGCKGKATDLCVDCGDAFCKTCGQIHLNMSMAKHHKLTALSTLTTETLAAARPVACKEHKDKHCELYCPMHTVSVCILCATTTHRQCPQVVTLQARQQAALEELDQLGTMLKDGESQLDVSLQQLEGHMKITQQQADLAQQDVQQLRQQLYGVVDENCDRLTKKLRQAVEDITMDITNIKTELLQRRRMLTLNQRVAERTRRHSELCSVADISGQLKARFTDTVHAAMTPLNMMVKGFTFTLNATEVTRLRAELGQLGEVTFSNFCGVNMLQVWYLCVCVSVFVFCVCVLCVCLCFDFCKNVCVVAIFSQFHLFIVYFSASRV